MYDIDPNIIPSQKLFAGPLSEKNLNAVFAVGTASSLPEHNFEHVTSSYLETVPITIYANDPEGSMEGTKIRWTCEAELRRVVEANYGGSLGVLRRFKSIKQAVLPQGGWNIYSATYDLEYRRVNPNYAPTYPAFSYGIAFTYQGDHVAGGAEGTWTLSAGSGSTCTQTITSDKKLYLNQTVFSADSSTVHGTSLGLSSTVYKRIRIRFKTSGSVAAKVVLGFSSGTQTVLAETVSTTFTVVDVAITDSKTINTITLYCCDGTGTVSYDFIQIYTGTYIIPVCTKLDPPFTLNDAVSEMPGRSGSSTQGLGSKSIEVSMDIDLDMEPVALTWKRPQTVSSKTDANNQDIFMEQLHLSGINQAFTWLDLGNPAMQFKARLVGVQPSYSKDARLTLLWREFRNGSATIESTIERFGLNL
jgi:hypothetical protein